MSDYSRRNFLKNGMKASILLAVHPFHKMFHQLSTKENIPNWEQLIDIARWCPTIHNLQPHQIKVLSETEADLYYDPKRLLPVGDPDAVFVTIALAMFIEHLSIAAGSFGWKVEMMERFQAVSTKANHSTRFARLKLSPLIEAELLDASLILKRKTSRLHYDDRPLNKNTVNQIREEALKFGHEFFHSAEKELVDFVIDLNQQTLFEDLESTPGREELHRLFRYTDEDAIKYKDGLWYKAMAFPGKLMRSVFEHHQRWEKGARKLVLGNYYQHSFKGTASVCWFGGAFETPEDWINAGKMFARSWLIITRENAYIHPFGSLITNHGAYLEINQKLTQATDNKKIWMIFRAGYSNEPVRSYRLSTKEIIIH
ncbi:MAG: hypothetical protein ACKOXP_06575 [Flavobacteriales bacterium]